MPPLLEVPRVPDQSDRGTDAERLNRSAHMDKSLLTRREVIGLLGGAAAGVAGAFGQNLTLAAAAQTARAASAVRFPRGAIIRTLLKDMSPESLGHGALLFHEHLSYNNAFFAKLRTE